MYNVLDTKQTNTLQLIKRGWFSPDYELTDGSERFGSLSYRAFSGRTGSVKIAGDNWTFEFEKFFSRTIVIIDKNGDVIGKATRKWFSVKTQLTMETGFQAEYYPKNLLWPLTSVWDSMGYGKIMSIKSSLLSFNYTVHIEPGMTPAGLMPLLIFLGAHLSILKRRRRAAQH